MELLVPKKSFFFCESYLISFIHITDTERNNMDKIAESSYKTYRVHRSSSIVGIAN